MKLCHWLVLFSALAVGLGEAGPASAEFMPPDPLGRIVVANRGAGTFSVIDVATHQITTLALPNGPGVEETMYFTYSAANNRFFVGDRGNNRVVVYDAGTFDVLGFVPAGNGVFHQWGTALQNQLWVVNDIDRTATVIDMLAAPGPGAVRATVPIAPGLGGTLHDIILDARSPQAFITVNGIAGQPDAVVRLSTDTFQQTGIVRPGDNLHVAVAGDNIYVPAQDSNLVGVYNRTTLAPVTDITGVPAAHGAEVNANESIFYTTNISGAGPSDIFAIDTLTNTIIGSTDTPFPTPHNVAVSPDGTRLYLTHSGATATQVTFYDIGPDGVPVFAGTLTTGLNPFAIAAIPAGTVVPEPASLALLLTGSTLLAGAAWRRRRQTAGAAEGATSA